MVSEEKRAETAIPRIQIMKNIAVTSSLCRILTALIFTKLQRITAAPNRISNAVITAFIVRVIERVDGGDVIFAGNSIITLSLVALIK
jgi:hypothetical protein